MSVKKRFHCIFPVGENVHLIKDVGMLPYMLQKEGFYESSISFYESEENLPYLNSEVKGLKYIKLAKIFENEDYNIFWFLLRNFWKFDFVMMFHPSLKKLLIANFFKFITFNQMKFYFKLDLDVRSTKFSFKKNLKFAVKKFLFSNVHLTTVETEGINNFLNTNTYIKSILLPNGYKVEDLSPNIEKENIFITVGRIGTYQKNTESILDACKKIKLSNWKFYIIGPIEDEFYVKIESFFFENPHLKDKVFFIGNVAEREKLMEYYSKSKVFVLTSRYESFGLVLLEALAHGNLVVSTDLVSSREITNDGKYSILYPVGDNERLSMILQSVINGSVHFPSQKEMRDYIINTYDWSMITKTLYSLLEK